VKDPTNYFWTVLADLQALARQTRLPDAELLLNFADTPVVYASDAGAPTGPGVPVFSYCKRKRFLDVLVPGYYTPDRVCRAYRERMNRVHAWHTKARRVFARFTHFCKKQEQRDAYGRKLPPCARSYFAALSETHPAQLDVRPLNVVNDTTDPSLEYGRKLLRSGESLPMADHGAYAYLLDTDGFTSAYKLQQLLATNSLVLHHHSPWRAFYHRALVEYVHYVPIWHSSRDDIMRVLGWLRQHDDVAERVALNGQHFACEHLTQPGRLCYWRKAIELYARFLDYKPSLTKRPRAFPVDRLNFMCRIRDGPVVCYYNVLAKGTPLPPGYRCDRPVPGINGSFEECWYRGGQPAAL
jgi:protein glucosyltransferase